jgi:hypothetical protein
VDFVAVVDQVIALLRQRGWVTYSTLKRQFQLDEAALEDVKNELIEGQRLAVDERGNVLVWTADAPTALPVPSTPVAAPAQPPLTYTPHYTYCLPRFCPLLHDVTCCEYNRFPTYPPLWQGTSRRRKDGTDVDTTARGVVERLHRFPRRFQELCG